MTARPSSCRLEIHPDFNALRLAQPGLAALSAHAGLFSSLAWFENLYTNGLAPSTARLHLPADTGGCLPLLEDKAQLSALGNYYSSLYGPAAGLPQQLASVFKEIGSARVDLHPLDPAAPAFPALKQALQAAGYRVDDYYCFGNWHHPVSGQCFSDYLAARPSQLRNTLRRGRQKLQQAGEWHIHIQQADDAHLDAAIAAFEHIYAHSWKGPEPQPDFIPSLCRLAASEGWLRLGILSLDNTPLAAQLWLTHQGVASIYKLAYVEAAAPYSAGTVLSAAMFEHAIDIDRVAEIDYLNGDEAYKRDWMSLRRERRGIIAFDLSQRAGLIAALRHWAGCCVRRLRSTIRKDS